MKRVAAAYEKDKIRGAANCGKECATTAARSTSVVDLSAKLALLDVQVSATSCNASFHCSKSTISNTSATLEAAQLPPGPAACLGSSSSSDKPPNSTKKLMGFFKDNLKKFRKIVSTGREGRHKEGVDTKQTLTEAASTTTSLAAADKHVQSCTQDEGYWESATPDNVCAINHELVSALNMQREVWSLHDYTICARIYKGKAVKVYKVRTLRSQH